MFQTPAQIAPDAPAAPERLQDRNAPSAKNAVALRLAMLAPQLLRCVACADRPSPAPDELPGCLRQCRALFETHVRHRHCVAAANRPRQCANASPATADRN